jgi:hypothetical protein
VVFGSLTRLVTPQVQDLDLPPGARKPGLQITGWMYELGLKSDMKTYKKEVNPHIGMRGSWPFQLLFCDFGGLRVCPELRFPTD